MTNSRAFDVLILAWTRTWKPKDMADNKYRHSKQKEGFPSMCFPRFFSPLCLKFGRLWGVYPLLIFFQRGPDREPPEVGRRSSNSLEACLIDIVTAVNFFAFRWNLVVNQAVGFSCPSIKISKISAGCTRALSTVGKIDWGQHYTRHIFLNLNFFGGAHIRSIQVLLCHRKK